MKPKISSKSKIKKMHLMLKKRKMMKKEKILVINVITVKRNSKILLKSLTPSLENVYENYKLLRFQNV
jgi:hypothetical protein